MNPRLLTSFFLVVGAILMMLMWGVLWPSSDSGATLSAEVKHLLDNAGRARTAGVIGTFAFIAVLIGYRSIANTLSELTKGIASQLVELAGALAVMCAAALVVQTGIMMAAIDGGTNAEALYLTGTKITDGIPMFWGIALFLIGGVGLYVQCTGEKNPIALLVRTIITACGVLMFVGAFFDNDNLENTTWVIVTIVTILVGIVFYLRGRQQA